MGARMKLEDRKKIIKSLKGKIMKLALSDYVCLVLIEELIKQLKELIFDKDEASVNLDNVVDKEHEGS